MSDTQPNEQVVPISSGPVICGRCRSAINDITIEEFADNTMRVRAGKLVIHKIEADCPDCGWTFYWTAREKTKTPPTN